MKNVLYFLRDLFWKDKLKKIIGIFLFIIILFFILAKAYPPKTYPGTRQIVMGTEEAIQHYGELEGIYLKRLNQATENTKEYRDLEGRLIKIRKNKKDSEDIYKKRDLR